MGRLQRLFNQKLGGGGTLSFADFVEIQGNNQMLDAEVLSPYLIQAFVNASAAGAPPELAALAGDPRLTEAISRLQSWDFSTPTGIDQGFDPGDDPAAPAPPDQAEIDASVAATIYAAWRGQVIRRVIDQTLASLPVPLDTFAPPSDEAMKALRRLLDNYDINGGVGSSLINFFVVPGVSDPEVARDIILLESLGSGLDLLASNGMAPAFGNSTDQSDYRWGKLHRVVFDHPTRSPQWSIPPAGSPLNVSAELRGFARAGGLGVLDASSHSARAQTLNSFMFSSGPARRMISTMFPDGPVVFQVIPGGESGTPGSPQQVDQLALWLVNAYKPLPVSLEQVEALAEETVTIICDDAEGPGCRLGPFAVGLDIKPGSFPNSINPKSRGVIPVAILGSETFDVADVDVTTLAFGPNGAPIAHRDGHPKDVNRDGITDLLLHFRTRETGLVCGDESATLTGETLGGEKFEGSDSIRTVGCRR
jgi:penicillin amidase